MGRGGKGTKERWEERRQEMTGRLQQDGNGTHSSGCLRACQWEICYFLLFIWTKHSQEDRKDEEIQKNATSTQEKVND